jgi:hypothetical protein
MYSDRFDEFTSALMNSDFETIDFETIGAETIGAHTLGAQTIAAGQFELNPLVSVPKLIDRVSTELTLNHSAAQLFLQILALPEPTDQNVKRWNSWTGSDLKAATAQLLKKELLVSGKRSRSGRSVFLRGTWHNAKAPALPIEAWKLPFYGSFHADQVWTSDLPRILPLDSAPALFEMAWARWVSGDCPS